MMEPLFENRSYTSRTVLMEFYKKLGMRFRPHFLLITGTLTIVATYLYCFGRSAVYLPVLSGVFFIDLLLRPYLAARRQLRITEDQNGGVIPESVVSFGDKIELRTAGACNTWEYENITKVVHLKHSYALRNGQKVYLLLRPEGFTKGTFEEFKDFLRQKCPDLVIPE